MHLRVFLAEKLLSLFKLPGYTFCGLTVGWVEGLVIAVGATGGAECAVTIGTGKPCMDRYLLSLVTSKTAKPLSVCVEFDHRPMFVIYTLQR